LTGPWLFAFQAIDKE
jgi:hypothetical protein